jgi:hypothetical protein
MTRASKMVALLGASTILVGWGCGGGTPSISSSTLEVTVKGTVTIKGKPATTGEVVFDPSNINRKAATSRSAKIADDGSYAITTMVGENMVTVQGPTVNQSGLTRNRKQYDVKSGESTLAIELP